MPNIPNFSAEPTAGKRFPFLGKLSSTALAALSFLFGSLNAGAGEFSTEKMDAAVQKDPSGVVEKIKDKIGTLSPNSNLTAHKSEFHILQEALSRAIQSSDLGGLKQIYSKWSAKYDMMTDSEGEGKQDIANLLGINEVLISAFESLNSGSTTSSTAKQAKVSSTAAALISPNTTNRSLDDTMSQLRSQIANPEFSGAVDTFLSGRLGIEMPKNAAESNMLRIIFIYSEAGYKKLSAEVGNSQDISWIKKNIVSDAGKIFNTFTSIGGSWDANGIYEKAFAEAILLDSEKGDTFMNDFVKFQEQDPATAEKISKILIDGLHIAFPDLYTQKTPTDRPQQDEEPRVMIGVRDLNYDAQNTPPDLSDWGKPVAPAQWFLDNTRATMEMSNTKKDSTEEQGTPLFPATAEGFPILDLHSPTTIGAIADLWSKAEYRNESGAKFLQDSLEVLIRNCGGKLTELRAHNGRLKDLEKVELETLETAEKFSSDIIADITRFYEARKDYDAFVAKLESITLSTPEDLIQELRDLTKKSAELAAVSQKYDVPYDHQKVKELLTKKADTLVGNYILKADEIDASALTIESVLRLDTYTRALENCLSEFAVSDDGAKKSLEIYKTHIALSSAAKCLEEALNSAKDDKATSQWVNLAARYPLDNPFHLDEDDIAIIGQPGMYDKATFDRHLAILSAKIGTALPGFEVKFMERYRHERAKFESLVSATQDRLIADTAFTLSFEGAMRSIENGMDPSDAAIQYGIPAVLLVLAAGGVLLMRRKKEAIKTPMTAEEAEPIILEVLGEGFVLTENIKPKVREAIEVVVNSDSAWSQLKPCLWDRREIQESPNLLPQLRSIFLQLCS